MYNQPDHEKCTYTDLNKARNEVESAQLFYEGVLAALTRLAIDHRIWIGKDDLQAYADLTSEIMGEHMGGYLRDLECNMQSMSETPDNHKELVEQAAEKITDSFRVKSIDWQNHFKTMFAPRQLTNPATLQAKGVI